MVNSSDSAAGCQDARKVAAVTDRGVVDFILSELWWCRLLHQTSTDMQLSLFQ
jgi:hypothetical protein